MKKDRTIEEIVSTLIEKYYEGSTTVEEEKTLTNYLKYDKSDNYKVEKAIFGYLASQKNSSKNSISKKLIPIAKWGSVAAVAIIVIIIGGVKLSTNNNYIAYVDGEKITNIDEVKRLEKLSLESFKNNKETIIETLKPFESSKNTISSQLKPFSNLIF